MAISAYATVWLSYANVFIALFITVYAFLFLSKTKRHRDRRPWDFLFLGSFLYLIYQIFNVLVLSGIDVVSDLDLTLLGNGMAFLYSGSILLAFVSQHDLIIRSHLILISKKDNEEEAEVDIEIGGKKPAKTEGSYVLSRRKK